MIYFLSGKFVSKKENCAIIEVGGVGFKVVVSVNAAKSLPEPGSSVKLFSHLHVREDGLELYGFVSEQELSFFEKLISINGIGPKSALNILSITKLDQLIAAINEGKVDLLTKASGVGKKTAERVVLELRGKLQSVSSEKIVKQMESDLDIEEALVGLGYIRQQAKNAISKIDPKIKNLEDRIKEALKKIKS